MVAYSVEMSYSGTHASTVHYTVLPNGWHQKTPSKHANKRANEYVKVSISKKISYYR